MTNELIERTDNYLRGNERDTNTGGKLMRWESTRYSGWQIERFFQARMFPRITTALRTSHMRTTTQHGAQETEGTQWQPRNNLSGSNANAKKRSATKRR